MIYEESDVQVYAIPGGIQIELRRGYNDAGHRSYGHVDLDWKAAKRIARLLTAELAKQEEQERRSNARRH